MTDRGKQILWGARVNASALLSLARRLSQNLFPLAAAGRSQTEEERGRDGRQEGDGRGRVQCSLPHFTCVTARTTGQNVYLAWST